MLSKNKAFGVITYTGVNICQDRLGSDKIVSFLDDVPKRIGSALLTLCSQTH